MKAFTIINLLKTYVALIKPERTLTNVLTAIAGFLFASQWQIEWSVFLALVAGSTAVIGSACVLNNYLDRDLDQLMARTKNRALASGQISKTNAIILAFILALIGFLVLSFTNWLTVAIIAVGYLGYVVAYGYTKRHTWHSTLIGTVPGGASLVAGYVAVTGRLDTAALILFLIMLSWQMVHFYAIAIYRRNDYAAAKIPVITVEKGVAITKKYMLAYLLIFIFAVSLLKWTEYVGYAYLVGILILSGIWLRQVVAGFNTSDNQKWARGVFKFSLVVLLVFCVLLTVGPTLF